MRGASTVELTVIWDLGLPSGVELLFRPGRQRRSHILGLLFLHVLLHFQIRPVLGEGKFLSMQRRVRILGLHGTHLEGKILFFNERVCRLIIDSCQWRYILERNRPYSRVCVWEKACCLCCYLCLG